MTDILIGAGTLAGVALLFGLLLMLVNKVFPYADRSAARRDTRGAAGR